MDRKVLVLDQSYQPIKVITWMRAITLVLSGKAEIVEDADIYEIRSVKTTFNLSNIIRVFKSVAHKKRKHKGVPFTRHNIFLRDNYTCQYCGKQGRKDQLNFDHVIPRSRGGATSWENIVAACYPCNGKKADRTPEEAGMKLLSKPVRPKNMVHLVVRMRDNKNIPESWKMYLDPTSFVYWNAELDLEM